MARITEYALKALKPDDAGTRIRDDGNLSGSVRVSRTPAHDISVCFEYRYYFETKIKSVGVGTWPKVKLSDIRKKRDEYRIALGQGLDPAVGKKTAKLEAKATAQARLYAVEVASKRITINDLFDRWEKAQLVDRKDKGKEVRRMMLKDVLPGIGTLAVEDVRKAHISALLLKIKERGVNRQVNVMLSLIRQMFSFAIDSDLIEANPTASLKKRNFGGKDVVRERVLVETEIKEFRDKLINAELPASAEAALWIMLSTLCRVGEISKVALADLDLDAQRWRIPPENAKNGKEHIIVLSPFAAAQFKKIINLKLSDVWLIPNRDDDNHIDDKAITKQVRDRQRTIPLKNRTSKVATLNLAGGQWTPHDLRRTGATMMGELGIRPDVIEKCLNHTEENKLVKVYQRQKLEAEQAEAWQLLGDRLELILRTDADNVVLLSEHQSAA